MQKVIHEDQLEDPHDKGRIGNECVEGNQVLHKLVDKRIIETPVHATPTNDEHTHENPIQTNHCPPEMPLGKGLIHHATKHFGKPEIGGGKASVFPRKGLHQVEEGRSVYRR